MDAFNSLATNKDEILQEYGVILNTLMDTRVLDTESEKILGEQVEIATAIQQLVNVNASTAMNQESYEHRYKELAERYETAERRLAQIAEQKRERATRRENMALVMQRLTENSELITLFDKELWSAVVERVVVRSAEEVIFILRDGSEVPWAIK